MLGGGGGEMAWSGRNSCRVIDYCESTLSLTEPMKKVLSKKCIKRQNFSRLDAKTFLT